MTPTQQLIAQMRPEEPGTAGHKTCGHDLQAYGLHVRNGVYAALAAALLAVVCCTLAAGRAEAWSTGATISGGGRAQPLALASDPAGNGVGVIAGATADSPLMLLERDAVAAPGGLELAWKASVPFPGGVPGFTTSTALAQSATAAAAGAGAAAIVVRSRADGSDTLTALARDAGDPFGEPATIVPGNFDRVSDVSVAVSAAGTVIVGFDAAHTGSPRAAYAVRLSGHVFGRPRVISLSGAGPVATAVGPSEDAVIAWTRAGRAEATLLDDAGKAGRYRVLGRAATRGEIAAAGGERGTMIAWEGPHGAVRVIRRGTTATAFGRVVTARRGTRANLSGMVAALDPFGIAYVAWREGRGAQTRILVARGRPGHRFTIDQVANGAGLGKPAMVDRPIGGTIVGFAARAGWQARKVPTAGGLPLQSTVSAAGTATAVQLARPFVGAGPGPRANLAWLQPSAPGPGFDLMESQETDP